MTQRHGFSLAWFAGCDLRTLAKAPSEKSFYDALGSTVLMVAAANGLALTIAAGYAFNVAPAKLWWLGCAWTAVVACGIERLILQLPGTRARFLPIVLIPRLALSILLAVQIGEPLMLRINQSEINDQLSVDRVSDIHVARSDAETAYAKKISSRTNAITSIRESDNALAARAEHFRFLSSCESSTPSCSHTGRPGCWTYCLHYRRIAQEAEHVLAARLPADRAAIGRLQGEIVKLRSAAAGDVRDRVHSIRARNGLVAREEALGTLERHHPAVRAEVWFLRLLFLMLDLLPLTVKLLRVLTIESPYEAACAAARAHNLSTAKREAEAARVEHERIGEQGRADIEHNRVRIQRELDERVAGATGGGALIAAPSLGSFVQELETHESRPVAIPSALRRAAAIGVAAIAATTAATVALDGGALMWLAIATTAAAAAVAMATRGFAAAPRWGLYATFATFVAGLALPLAISGIALTS